MDFSKRFYKLLKRLPCFTEQLFSGSPPTGCFQSTIFWVTHEFYESILQFRMKGHKKLCLSKC